MLNVCCEDQLNSTQYCQPSWLCWRTSWQWKYVQHVPCFSFMLTSSSSTCSQPYIGISSTLERHQLLHAV